MLTAKFLALFAYGAEWVTWILVVTSLFGTAVVVDRLVLLLRTPERFEALRAALAPALREGQVAAVLDAVRGDSIARNVLRAGLALVAAGERRPEPVEQVMLGELATQRARYERRLASLLTIGNIGPLIGLLGTVIGIVQAFLELGKLGTMQASANQVVMAAIGEALVATGIGIGVSIPAVIFYNAVKAHLGVRLKQSEALQRELVAWLPRLPAAGARG